jgi:hypothetical protein
MIALATEKRDCCEHDLAWTAQHLPPARSAIIKPLPWADAADLFRARALRLFPHLFADISQLGT